MRLLGIIIWIKTDREVVYTLALIKKAYDGMKSSLVDSKRCKEVGTANPSCWGKNDDMQLKTRYV